MQTKGQYEDKSLWGIHTPLCEHGTQRGRQKSNIENPDKEIHIGDWLMEGPFDPVFHRSQV